jgi:hypothetical protein
MKKEESIFSSSKELSWNWLAHIVDETFAPASKMGNGRLYSRLGFSTGFLLVPIQYIHI